MTLSRQAKVVPSALHGSCSHMTEFAHLWACQGRLQYLLPLQMRLRLLFHLRPLGLDWTAQAAHPMTHGQTRPSLAHPAQLVQLPRSCDCVQQLLWCAATTPLVCAAGVVVLLSCQRTNSLRPASTCVPMLVKLNEQHEPPTLDTLPLKSSLCHC